jgi:hypothetical protein
MPRAFAHGWLASSSAFVWFVCFVNNIPLTPNSQSYCRISVHQCPLVVKKSVVLNSKHKPDGNLRLAPFFPGIVLPASIRSL